MTLEAMVQCVPSKSSVVDNRYPNTSAPQWGNAEEHHLAERLGIQESLIFFGFHNSVASFWKLRGLRWIQRESKTQLFLVCAFLAV